MNVILHMCKDICRKTTLEIGFLDQRVDTCVILINTDKLPSYGVLIYLPISNV